MFFFNLNVDVYQTKLERAACELLNLSPKGNIPF